MASLTRKLANSMNELTFSFRVMTVVVARRAYGTNTH